MIVEPLPWLPPAAPGAFERQLSSVLDGWAEQWLCKPRAFTVESAETSDDPTIVWRGSGGAAVGSTAQERVILGGHASGGAGDPDNMRDRAILGHIGQAAIDHLANRLCAIAGSAAIDEGPPEPCQPRFCATTVGFSLTLSLDHAAQVRLRRKVSGARKRPALGTLAQALAPEKVRLGCHLGSAALSAAEVAALCTGDLIVLDRRLAERLPLAAEGKATARGQASFEAGVNVHSLLIQEPIDLSLGND